MDYVRGLCDVASHGVQEASKAATGVVVDLQGS